MGGSSVDGALANKALGRLRLNRHHCGGLFTGIGDLPNRHEKRESGFCVTPYCFVLRKVGVFLHHLMQKETKTPLMHNEN